MHALYTYLDKAECAFSSYFSHYLPRLEENIRNDVLKDLSDEFRGGNVPILIIGGCGFIGSHIAVTLKKLGATSVDLIDIKHPSSLLIKYATDIATRFYALDITNSEELKSFFEGKTYHYIFNFASNQTDPMGRQNPAETVRINVDGLLNIVTAIDSSEVLKNNLRCLIHASTDKVLSMQEVFQTDRWDNLEKKISTYDASKLAGDTLALIQSRITKIPFCIIRLCNIFGPYDDNYTFRFIPKELARMVSEQVPPKYCHDSANDWREYLYIDDACRIILQVAKGRRRFIYKVITLPGCYYEKTEGVAKKLLEIYNNLNGEEQKIHGSPQAEACKRKAMIREKERASAMDLLSVDSTIGYYYTFDEGISHIIRFYKEREHE